MRTRSALPIAACLLAWWVAAGRPVVAVAAQSGRGTIKGHVRLTGKLPGNVVIRMGADPMCARMNAGKRILQESAAATADGSLAYVFVKVQGSFPQTPVPTEPVTIDQRGCVYGPRVVGVRVGQVLQVRNSDALLHNVHGVSGRGNDFNIGQPMAGMVNKFTLKNDEIMLRLRCDIHSWMTAFIAIVPHPYFAVSSAAGTFEIPNVPAGRHTIETWHERFGPLTQTVQVPAGGTATVELTYTGTEKPPTAGIQDLTVPAGVFAARFVASPGAER
jgi:plastocyanin